MPLGVVTVTSTGPTLAAAGLTAVMDVSLLTVNEAAGVPPKLTAVAPVKLLPVIVTAVPPASGPLNGLTPVTTGTGTGTLVTASANGPLPTPMVFVTVLLAVSIAETVLLAPFANSRQCGPFLLYPGLCHLVAL